MNKIEARNVVSFYHFLYLALSRKVYNGLIESTFVKLYEGVKDLITWKVDLSIEFFERLHDICNKDDKKGEDFDVLDVLTQSVFRDLAKHLREPAVRQIVDYFVGVSGCDSDTVLFVHKTSVRQLGDGYTVVTLVVNNEEGLNDLLTMNKKIKQVYSV